MTLSSRKSAESVANRSIDRRRRRRCADAVLAADAPHSDEEYRVGPGHPPKEHQFKPGQSGNPRGPKRKTSLAPDLKAVLERALSETVTLRRGERHKIITKAAAGITTLVDQYVGGDRHARRDLIALAKELGVDLTAGQGRGIENTVAEAITANDEAIITDYLRRHGVQPEQYRASRIDLTSVKEDTDKVNAPEEKSP
jgi:Family of unknown function (DUF5681)